MNMYVTHLFSLLVLEECLEIPCPRFGYCNNFTKCQCEFGFKRNGSRCIGINVNYIQSPTNLICKSRQHSCPAHVTL